MRHMNKRSLLLLKNFSYAISSNLISLLISTLVVIIVPRLISIREYSFWQLYLFYSSYVGFFQFGWNDGIYLRYGGKSYVELDKRMFFSQFWMLFSSQMFISVVIFVLTATIYTEPDMIFILRMVSVFLLLAGTKAMLLFIMQATNRIKEYAQVTILQRISYFIIVALLLLFGVREYRFLIISDIIGAFLSLLFAMFLCKDIVFRKISGIYFSFAETLANISVGIKLMFANIASMLVIGIVRFGIERTWSVETFGKVSLTLNVSSMIMIFINSIGIIMFPMLRRTEEKRLPEIYAVIRDILMFILLFVLIMYYPMKMGLSLLLPKYTDSLKYMALLFPMFISESKMSLLINTYLKTLREEKILLRINVYSVMLSAILTIVTTILVRNLDFAILSIVVLLAIRSLIAEIALSRILGIQTVKDIALEIGLAIVFILSAWFISSWLTALVYGIAYLSYLTIKRYDIKGSLNKLRSILNA